MLLSVNWLKDFIPLNVSADDLAERLIMAGIEVEQITRIGTEWDNIVVGEILDIRPHPQADKLLLTSVQAGDRKFPVVCGAPNIQVGHKVPLALEGASLPSGIKIKAAKIRGEISQGMLCSEPEISLGDDASGIMILPPSAPSGILLADYLGLSDTVLELSVTPNRPDCLSVIGIAREIAALIEVPMHVPEIVLSEEGAVIDQLTSVEIRDSDLCPRYTARIISNISIGPSPLWMRQRLAAAGIRSINNAVDVTNYVLLEWGQPLHAFDFALLRGHKIIVKRADPDERFLTLDGTERVLTADALMICDGERSVALGGIMGGQNSEVHEGTKTILLESAYFTPASICRTSKATGLSTEASQRFEKGVDINGVIPALNRAASLIASLCTGAIAPGIIDCYPQPVTQPGSIALKSDRVRKIIGIPLATEAMQRLLERLHMTVTNIDQTCMQVTLPSFRVDIHEPEDLIEEIARLNGYANIPATAPRIRVSDRTCPKSHKLTSRTNEMLVAQGFYEVINYSFISPALLQHMNFTELDQRHQPVSILNPLSESQSVLRTCLIPGLLINLRDNLRHKNNSIRLFEIGTVFYTNLSSNLPAENKRVSGLISGYRFNEIWNLPQAEADFFDIKGCVETFLEKLYIPSLGFSRDIREPFLHPRSGLLVEASKQPVGCLGEVHPEVLEKFDIDQTAYIFDFDFDLLCTIAAEQRGMFMPLPRYPAVYRDVALIVDEQVAAETVYRAIISFKNKLITDVVLFDCFSGRSIPAGKKSLAYRIKFQSDNRSLTDEEVNTIHEKLVSCLFKEIGAELRN
jgi:phenylalanyl-tRNA synthetase beta chain